jgi:hypothetical protein
MGMITWWRVFVHQPLLHSVMAMAGWMRESGQGSSGSEVIGISSPHKMQKTFLLCRLTFQDSALDLKEQK